jgi:hypothetical protein
MSDLRVFRECDAVIHVTGRWPGTVTIGDPVPPGYVEVMWNDGHRKTTESMADLAFEDDR